MADHRDVPRSLSKLKERIEQPGMPTESEFDKISLREITLSERQSKKWKAFVNTSNTR